MQVGQMATDRSGYCYIPYTVNIGGTYFGHLLKLGPTNNIAYDAVTGAYGSPFSVISRAAVVSQNQTGTQSVFVVENVVSPDSTVIRYNRFHTDGSFVTAGNVTPYTVTNFVAAYATSDFRLMLALNGTNDGGISHNLSIVEIDPNTGFHGANASMFNVQAAQYDPYYNQWFATGIDDNDLTGLSAVWGAFDGATGAKNFGGNLLGSGDPINGPFSRFRFYADLLPGHQFALTSDETDNDGAGTNSSSFLIQVKGLDDSGVWQYPASGLGSTFGQVTQVVQSAAGFPLFAVGLADDGPAGFPLQFLLSLTSTGTLSFNRAEQPVEKLFAMQDGFWDLFNWSSSSSVFLEHFSFQNAVNNYLWGKQYQPSTVQDFNGRLAQFGNEAFVTHDFNNELWIDRFFTGTTLASIVCPPTFTAGSSFNVTINLNRAVQTGESITVALNSSSPNVLMPNGTQAQNFTLSPGISTMNVTVTTTAGSYPVRFLGINQGVRRTADSTGS